MYNSVTFHESADPFPSRPILLIWSIICWYEIVVLSSSPPNPKNNHHAKVIIPPNIIKVTISLVQLNFFLPFVCACCAIWPPCYLYNNYTYKNKKGHLPILLFRFAKLFKHVLLVNFNTWLIEWIYAH